MPNDLIANEAQYKKLARKVAEGSIVTDALARLIEQIIAEVHDSRIEPQAARIAELEAEVARLRTAATELNEQAAHACLRALLPSPPLVIEPGRWYRTRDGRKAFVIEVTDDGVRGFLFNPAIAAFVIYEWHPGGTVWMEDDPADADLIALWEDTDAV